MRLRFAALGLLASGSLLAPQLDIAAEKGPAAPADDWRTPAEVTDYESTPTLAETVQYLGRLAKASPSIRVGEYGTSAAGRALPYLIASRDRAFTPAAAHSLGKPILMLQAGIHAGEIDGKDSLLALLRDMIRNPESGRLLDKATLLIIPVYNVDGHERISAWNRPNQDGPHQGMGWRTTTDGHDLNRDHIKLDTPEARALVALFDRWRPDIHVDLHVTDGALYDWPVTFSWAEAPVLDAPIDLWRQQHLSSVLSRLAQRGFPNGPYVSLESETDFSKGIEWGTFTPRFSTIYFALRHRLSVLVETNSHAPYKTRVLATYAFLEELINEAGENFKSLRAAIDGAEKNTVEAGLANAPPSQIDLQWESSPGSDTVVVPFHPHHPEDSVITGKPVTLYDAGPSSTTAIPWRHTPVAKLRLQRPRGYLIPPGWPAIESRVEAQRLRTVRLTQPLDLKVETARVSSPKFASSSYQGHLAPTFDVNRKVEVRRFPAGTLFVPADQPDFPVAVHLLEPEAPDSLLSWGLLSSVFERKEWIDGFILEQWARLELQRPERKAEWEAALSDPAFAADPDQRYIWWFMRHPSFDAEFGLVPIFRLLERPAALN